MTIFFSAGLIMGLFFGSITTMWFFRKQIIEYQELLIEATMKNKQSDMVLAVWNYILNPKPK
jgi:hypothetical protein